MISFWLAYAIPASLSLITIHRRYLSLLWLFLFFSFVVFVGLRHEVGGDWGSYVRSYESVKYYSFLELISLLDPGYVFLNWISYQLDGGVYLVNTLSAIIFFSGLIVFCRAQPLPFLAFTIAVPYMISVVSMGYTRQAIALGFVMFGFRCISAGGFKRYLFCIAIASLFHKSVVLLFPLVIFYQHRGLVRRMFSWGPFSLIIGYLFFLDHFKFLWLHYVEDQMQSDGASIRLLMNALPSLLFFIFYRKIKRRWPDDYLLWFGLALVTIVLLLLVNFASTAVDRLALYIIPLQLVVFSRLPMLFSVSGGRATVIRLIVAYYALVLFVWFNFATHVLYWLPYQNIITLDIF